MRLVCQEKYSFKAAAAAVNVSEKSLREWHAPFRPAAEKTVTTLGRLDVLVNNAGTVIPVKIEQTTLADFDRVFAVNVRGTFVATQAALKHLKPGGRIIMIGSSLGERVFMPGMGPTRQPKGPSKCSRKGWRVNSERTVLRPTLFSRGPLTPI